MIQDNQSIVPMDKLLELYTTFGFPIDIIKQLCEENNVKFDADEYNNLMENHIKKSKEGRQFK